MISLFARRLAYNLRSRFGSEMGWKFGGEVGSLPCLGSVLTRADSIYFGKEEEDAALLNSSFKYGTKITLNSLKYSPVNPSGPGALELGTFSIFFLVSQIP